MRALAHESRGQTCQEPPRGDQPADGPQTMGPELWLGFTKNRSPQGLGPQYFGIGHSFLPQAITPTSTLSPHSEAGGQKHLRGQFSDLPRFPAWNEALV